MCSLKTQIEISKVEDFLRKNFSVDIKNMEILKGGEISQAFSFNDSSGSYVIKVRKVRKRFRKADPFRKEITVSDIVKKEEVHVPIPKIVRHGIFKECKNEKFIYSIAEMALGSFVHLFPKEKSLLVDGPLIDVLHNIHSIDISKTEGYGDWQEWNKAKAAKPQQQSREKGRCQYQSFRGKFKPLRD